MTLQEMFRTVWFGKWLVLVSVLAALAGAWLYVSRQEPEYASEATVQTDAPDAEAFVCPVAPTVAPFVGNSVSAVEVVVPLAPPTAVCVTVPPEVAIDEAVSLAREFCGADAPGFVNGILGAAAREAVSSE